MFTYHSANTSAAQPALVNAIEQGLRADVHGGIICLLITQQIPQQHNRPWSTRLNKDYARS
ncbi:hypothetical protein C1D41_000173 [Salmonella enterica subsp. enterica serovar Nottingham]|nr:hypothetical protein [Salmonella enterica subsp. enterica serovar Nottingham]